MGSRPTRAHAAGRVSATVPNAAQPTGGVLVSALDARDGSRSSMDSALRSRRALLLPRRRLILLLVFVQRGRVVTALLSIQEDAGRVSAEDSFRPLDEVAAIIWSGCANVILQQNG